MISMNKEEPFILWAEDDPDDFELFVDALHTNFPNVRVVHVKNGKEVMDKLDTLTNLPSLIVLDLNMPVLDGKATISQLKVNTRFYTLPIIVLTTSSNSDEQHFFDHYNIEMITKPSKLSDIDIVVDKLVQTCNAFREISESR